jgi:hypothetical protein
MFISPSRNSDPRFNCAGLNIDDVRGNFSLHGIFQLSYTQGKVPIIINAITNEIVGYFLLLLLFYCFLFIIFLFFIYYLT